MTIKDWSTDPAQNASAGTINWAEGMAPNAVNDSARAMMADIRGQWEDDGWFDAGDTPTFVDAGRFRVNGDLTHRYHTGRRIRCDDSSLRYGRITDSSYAAPFTEVSVDLQDGDLTSALSAVAVSLFAAENSALAVEPSHLSPNVAIRELLAEAEADDSAVIDFTTGLDAPFDEFELRGSGIRPLVNGDNLHMRMSSNGGVSFYDGPSDYRSVVSFIYDAESHIVPRYEFDNIVIGYGCSAADEASLLLRISRPQILGPRKFISSRVWGVDFQGAFRDQRGGGCIRNITLPINGLRLYAGGGPITAGVFRLYGVKD